MLFSRLRLQRAALRLVAHGWPVTPGAPLRARRFDCGRPGCPTRACHPATERWQYAACRSAQAVVGWWSRHAYSLLLPTGLAFDVIEVPAPVGMNAFSGLFKRSDGPVAATPTGRWMFLVAPGRPLLPELDRRLDLVRHTRGSWVPAPPTRLAEGPVRWVVTPAESGWRLPDPLPVQRRLAAALTPPPPALEALM